MAMLAGPRRKQKVINLRAKNSAWSNDNNKFGQRMLEKMGWTSGKGLGANENGIVEHVVARYKNDEKGLGYEDKNDQWTKHEDDFNALLANLSNDDTKEIKLHSGVSLEDKSKKSRKRIHYHKFTRGKDISRYSEKDLANIFGKKTFKNTGPEITQDTPKEDEDQLLKEKGSMVDYFKNKLSALKSKFQLSDDEIDRESNNEANFAFQGFSGTNEIESCHSEFSNTKKESLENSPCQEELVKKKKKKAKNEIEFNYNYEETQKDSEVTIECLNEMNTEDPVKKKSKKKRKRPNDDVSQLLVTNVTEETENVRKPKKLKKDTPVVDDISEPNEKIVQKRKKNTAEVSLNQVDSDVLDTELIPKKKMKRKSK